MESNATLQPLTILQYLALIHKVSYSNVCREVGLTPQQFSDWVKKRRPVPKERLQALAGFFNVDTNLLIDENHYLRDLSPEVKIDVQILFLDQMLKNEGENTDTEGYRDKLERLQREKRKQALISRFTTILDQEDRHVEKLCLAFMDHMEHGRANILEQLLTAEGNES